MASEVMVPVSYNRPETCKRYSFISETMVYERQNWHWSVPNERQIFLASSGMSRISGSKTEITLILVVTAQKMLSPQLWMYSDILVFSIE